MNSKMDPMGRTIADYWKTKKADRLRVFSPIFEEDEIPLSTLFRKYKAMPKIERKALGMAKTCQYGGLTILGVEGYQRLKSWFKRKRG
ncbi:MAG: hypothetical protein J5952_09155 [Prevotella sp.]|nr:hypothetical protein [Prevotella sp.]MBO5580566.1 hypothetical protein [Prevotella sp.]